MDREYDIFEELPDGSPLWRDHADGLRAAMLLLKKVAKSTKNGCFVMCLHDKQIVGRANVRHDVGSKPVIFQIGYDPKLSLARAEILRAHGYEAVTVIGNEAAKLVLETPQHCDLFLVGNAAPLATRREMVQWLKLHFRHVPVIALNPNGMEVPEANYCVAQNDAEVWLPVVARAVKRSIQRGA